MQLMIYLEYTHTSFAKLHAGNLLLGLPFSQILDTKTSLTFKHRIKCQNISDKISRSISFKL